MKKLLAGILASAMALSMAACGSTPAPAAPAPAPAPESKAAEPAPAPAPAAPAAEAPKEGEKPYIALVSKGFQHQFWQVVKKGAEQAAIDNNVDITFDGPPTESDIAIQVDMLNSAMNKNPAAICLAALDTESVMDQLNNCKAKGIPVVGFDSGVPNAPEGSIYATASTDNFAAAGIAAQHLFDNADFKAKLAAATVEKPIAVGVLAQDATSDSIVKRSMGFTDKLAELVGKDDVQVTGHDKFKKDAPNGAKLIITVNVPATTAPDAMKTGGESLMSTDNLVAVYGSNEAGIGGLLAASNDGADFEKAAGKYKDIICIGFDAGKTQKVAVQNGWMLGSVTQDPYQIGYKAVALAVDALAKKPTASEIVDTGAKWYDAEALKDPMINDLVYE